MKKLYLGLILATASSSALADSLVYGGVATGQYTQDGDSGATYTMHVGTGILPFVGLEAGMTQFGEVTLDNGDKSKSTSYFVAARPSIDIGPIRVFAKGGLQKWSQEINGSKVDDGINVTYGVGADYFLSGPLTLGASYESTRINGKDVGNFMLNFSVNLL